jgi:predicted nucleic acid-binding protein
VIVVDSNIVAYLYLPGAYTERAESLLGHDSDWAAPILWRSEFRNILTGYLRRKLLAFDHAIKIQREAESLLLGAEYEIESERVLALARDSTCSAYDCEFVALAMKLNARLVTMDRALLRAFPNCTQPLPAS